MKKVLSYHFEEDFRQRQIPHNSQCFFRIDNSGETISRITSIWHNTFSQLNGNKIPQNHLIFETVIDMLTEETSSIRLLFFQLFKSSFVLLLLLGPKLHFPVQHIQRKASLAQNFIMEFCQTEFVAQFFLVLFPEFTDSQ